MLTNNGKVLYHPDFRPIVCDFTRPSCLILIFNISQFQDMLKPYYTSIDLNEVEISNETFKSRVIIQYYDFHKLTIIYFEYLS